MMQTRRLGQAVDAYAPDGSQIRLLAETSRGSCAHCTLPAGAVTRAVEHRTVEEIWYVLEGRGELWRKGPGGEKATALESGVSVSIPIGTAFQFRAGAEAPLRFLIVTMPPWPGGQEALRVEDHWPPTL